MPADRSPSSGRCHACEIGHRSNRNTTSMSASVSKIGAFVTPGIAEDHR
jgi:hypothetical protein